MPIKKQVVKQKIWNLGGALAVSMALFAPAAQADILRYNGPAYSPYDGAFGITDSSPYTSINVYAGAFNMTNLTAGGSFMAWCVDIYHTLNTSSAGASYTLRTAEQFYGAGSQKITNLERLASYVFGNGLLTNNVQSAAFQLATWEIVNEANTASPYSISNNDFRVTSGDTNARSLANQWLGVVNAGTQAITYDLAVWDGPNSTQDLAVFSKVVTPVPEPETYGMLLAGLGFMAFVARRRKQLSSKGSV